MIENDQILWQFITEMKSHQYDEIELIRWGQWDENLSIWQKLINVMKDYQCDKDWLCQWKSKTVIRNDQFDENSLMWWKLIDVM